MIYRPEVDGLRALAIIPVVLFHLGLNNLSGGYIGVDIFFVISGYLITSILYNDLQNNSFSIIRFYERRIRRIFPPLFFVLFTTSVICWFIFLPEEFIKFGRSLSAAAIFLSNVLFWNEAGYFDAAAETKPLLHTWSLAVEEQFYLFFPPFLYLLFRYTQKNIVKIIGVSLAVSLSLSIWLTNQYPNASFYLIPGRTWELGVGALIALGAFPVLTSVRWSNTLSILGFILIIFSIITFDVSTSFPGIAALIPCAGAALIIHSTHHNSTLIGKILSLKPVIFIGLISYSLYLWHWPVIVFYKHLSLKPFTIIETFFILVLSILLAILSWHFIEKPFRGKDSFLSKKPLFVLAILGISGFIGVGSIIANSSGMKWRLPDSVIALSNVSKDSPKYGECYLLTGKEVNNNKLCKIGNKQIPPGFIVWGDSHAYALMPIIDKLANEFNLAGIYAPQGACAPLIGVVRKDKKASPICYDFNQAVQEYIEKTPSIKSVLLIGRWAENFEVKRFTHNSPLILRDVVSPESGDSNNEAFERGLIRTLEFLKRNNLDTTIVAQVPDLKFNPSRYLAIEQLLQKQLTKYLPLTEHKDRQKNVMELIHKLSNIYGVKLIYPDHYLCDENNCSILKDGTLLYRDNTHLSVSGTNYIKDAFVPYFVNLKDTKLSKYSEPASTQRDQSSE
jgi:peptidoglycan/LPS O-acetylase OafA/YrhL